jgi:hypothetical protein
MFRKTDLKRKYHRVTINMSASESVALGAMSYLEDLSPAKFVRHLIRKTARVRLPTLRKEIEKEARA